MKSWTPSGNNTTSGSVSKGTSHFGGGTKSQPTSQGSTMSGNKMPTHNGPKAKVNLGTTKHGVGEVPGYLKGK